MESKRHYLKSRDNRLHAWDREIKDLRTRAKALPQDRQAAAEAALRRVATARNHAWMHLDTLKGTATNVWGEQFDHVWDSVREKVEAAADALAKALEEARGAVA